MNELPDNLAVSLKDSYVENIEQFNENLQDVLLNGFEMSNDEVFEFLNENEKDAYDYIVQELKVIFRQTANQVMLRKFSDNFKKT